MEGRDLMMRVEKLSPRRCLALLALGVALSWLVALVALVVIHVLGRWTAEMLGWL
jgi:hypothetical protein